MQDLIALLCRKYSSLPFVGIFLLGFSAPAFSQGTPCEAGVRIPDEVVTQVDCITQINLEGLETSSIVWRDLNSSNGKFLRYLDCSRGCSRVTVSADEEAERFIRYEICGTVSADNCSLNYEVCDTLVLEVQPVPRLTSRVDICEGFVYEWQGRNFTEEGFYTDTLVSSIGCDSLVSLDLKVNPAPRGELSATICPGGTYKIGGEVFTDAGTYQVTLTDSINCDSIVTLNLEVLPGVEPKIIAPKVLCDGTTAELKVSNGATFQWSTGETSRSIFVDAPGKYSVTVTSNIGCTTPVSYTLEGSPPLDPSISGGGRIDCANRTVSFQSAAYVDPEASNVRLAWLDKNGRVLSNDPVYQTTLAGWYYLRINTPGGDCVAIDSIQILEDPDLPTFSLSKSGDLDCSGDETTLSVDVDPSQTNLLVRWTGPGILSGNPVLSVSEPGWYVMEVTNTLSNCANVDSIEVKSENKTPEVILPDEVTLSCTASSVSFAAGVTKGNPSFNWRTTDGRISGATDLPTVTVTRPGWYYLDLVDLDNECATTDSVLVIDPEEISGISMKIKAFCANEQEGGEIKVRDVEGGSTPFKYTLNGGEETGTGEFIELDPGLYTLGVTDGYGCQWDTTIRIRDVAVEPSLIIEEICEGGSFEWNGKSYSEAGIYVDTLTTLSGCDSVATLDLRVNNTGVAVTIQATFCPGTSYEYNGQTFKKPGSYSIPVPGQTGCDSLVTLELTHIPVEKPEIIAPPALCRGDTAQLSLNNNYVAYSWSTGSVNSSIVTRDGGKYTVTVTDENGCSDEATYRLDETEIPVAAIVAADTMITCQDPSVLLEADPSLTGYVFTWLNPRGDEISEEAALQATDPGEHVLIASDPTGTCASTDTFFVTVSDDVPLFTIDSPEEITCTRTEVSLSAQAGGPAQQAAWNGPGIIAGASTFSPTVNRTGLYRIVVTDTNTGCVASGTVTVTSDQQKPLVNVSGETRLDCLTNEASLLASSPDPTVTYRWETTEGIIKGAANQAEVTVGSTGWYELTTTDTETGCPTLDRIFIDYPPGPTDVKARTIPTCENEEKGYLIVDEIIDGEPLFTYSLNGALPPDDHGAYTDLAPGAYQLNLIDSMGCTFPISMEIGSLPVPETVQVAEICEGQAFMWKDSLYSLQGRYIDTLEAANGCDSLDILDLQILPAPRQDLQISLCEGEVFQVGDSLLTQTGTYMFFSANPGGCDSLFQIELTVTEVDTLIIQGPAEFCAGETVQLQASGNFSAFEWNTGGVDSMLDISSGGIYSLTATNSNGCSRSAAFEILENPMPSVAIAGDSMITCQDPSISLQAQGFDPASGWSLAWLDSLQRPVGNGEILDVTDSGIFFLEVTDPVSGCSAKDSVEVVDGSAFPEISLPDFADLTCFQPEIDLIATLGGDQNGIDLLWTGPGVDPGQSGMVLRVDQPGWFVISATDNANGCTAADSINVMNNQTPPVITLTDSVSLSCLTDRVALTGNAGTGAFSYRWTTIDGRIEGSIQQPNIEALAPGLYFLEITDEENGCSARDSALVKENDGPRSLEMVIEPNCSGETNSLVIVTAVNGGAGPYTYSLDGNPVGGQNSFRNLESGSYNLSVEDAEGCSIDTTLIISTLPPLSVNFGADKDIRLGDSIFLRPEVSVPLDDIAEVTWSPQVGLSCTDCLAPIATPETFTTYRVKILDVNGCSAEAAISIAVDPSAPVYIPNAFSPNGDGINDRFTVFSYDTVRRIKEFRVFNRWGAIVFEAEDFPPNDPNIGWDGTLNGQILDSAVYVYYAVVELFNGKEAVFKGDVSLIR